MMQPNSQPRRRLLESALMRHPEAVVPTTIRLWRQLAPELISIIGEGGFRPLYARSVRLVCVQFPWMVQAAAQPLDIEGFAQLQALLQAQDLAQAGQASTALFTIFLDILASLIGEELTTHLLRSAWNPKTSKLPSEDSPK